MITAVDTNVLLDIFGSDSRFVAVSGGGLRNALADGAVIACDVVWAEVAGMFPDRATVVRAMGALPIGFSPLTVETALTAGELWRSHQSRTRGRERILADFLIGAHASIQADRLLTRDRGFYRTYFRGLTVVDPAP